MNELQLWVTNVSKQIQKIDDLNYLKLYPNQSIDLFALKKPKFTQEQIENSIYIGSLSRKKDVLYLSLNPPNPLKRTPLLTINKPFPKRLPSVIEVETKQFEELGDQLISKELKNLISED